MSNLRRRNPPAVAKLARSHGACCLYDCLTFAPAHAMEEHFGITIENLLLGGHETYWRDLFPFLESHGYTLRPRYHPDWKPIWPPPPDITIAHTEDWIGLPVRHSRGIVHL